MQVSNLRQEAVDAEHHIPGPLAVRAPRTGRQFPVVLADAATWIHREANVVASLVTRIERGQQVAGEEGAPILAISIRTLLHCPLPMTEFVNPKRPGLSTFYRWQWRWRARARAQRKPALRNREGEPAVVRASSAERRLNEDG